jgi:hypothetical protein
MPLPADWKSLLDIMVLVGVVHLILHPRGRSPQGAKRFYLVPRFGASEDPGSELRRAFSGRVSSTLRSGDSASGLRHGRGPGAPWLVSTYPGGRVTRRGFIQGSINPQRDTKVSVDPPSSGYGCELTLASNHPARKVIFHEVE